LRLRKELIKIFKDLERRKKNGGKENPPPGKNKPFSLKTEQGTAFFSLFS